MPESIPADRIRVLRVIARLNIGGPAYHVSLLSGLLDPKSYETLLVAGKVGPGEGSFEELADRYGARLEIVPSLGPELNPIRDARAFVALWRTMRRFRPRIVHTHTAKAGVLGRLAAITAFARRPITVHTFHGHVLEGYFGRVATTFYRLLERWLARVTDRLIAVSEATVEDLVRLRVAPRHKFEVIQVGLDVAPFVESANMRGDAFRAEIGARPEHVVFTYAGRLVPIKRIDRAIRALAQAHEAGAAVMLAIVGDGPLRGELAALRDELHLDDAVAFLGYRPRLEDVLAGTDVAVLTSANEGTPVFLIEASAAGKPSVATAVGGVPDVVTRETGVLVAEDDEAALADAYVRLARDAELRARLGSSARAHVKDRFAHTRLLQDVDGLYRRLLAES